MPSGVRVQVPSSAPIPGHLPPHPGASYAATMRLRDPEDLWPLGPAPCGVEAVVMAQRGGPTTVEARTEQVAWFGDLAKPDVPRVGGKGANLGELTGPGCRCRRASWSPPQAYLDAMEAGGVRRGAARARRRRRRGRPRRRSRGAASELQALVRAAGVPATLRRAVRDAYAAAGRRTPVAVRSSATAEDAAVDLVRRDERDLHQRARRRRAARARSRDCWASLFGAARGRLPRDARASTDGAGDRRGRAADGRLRARRA